MSLMWSQEGVHCPVVIFLLMPNLLLALQLKLKVLLCWLPSGPHHGYEGLLFRTQGQGCGWDMSSRSRLVVAIATWLVVVVYRYWWVVVCCTLVVVLPGCSISLVGPVLVPVVIVAGWLLWYVGLLPLCVVVSGLGRVVPLGLLVLVPPVGDGVIPVSSYWAAWPWGATSAGSAHLPPT